jgi:hypothetical protein
MLSPSQSLHSSARAPNALGPMPNFRALATPTLANAESVNALNLVFQTWHHEPAQFVEPNELEGLDSAAEKARKEFLLTSESDAVAFGASAQASQHARDIVQSIMESADALEIMFGGSAACVGSDLSPGSADAFQYEKSVFVEDSKFKLSALPFDHMY